MAKITTLLFDFDGTLLDTNELIIQTFQTVLNSHYPGRFERENILPFLGPTLKDTFDSIDPEKSEELIAEYRTWNLANHDAFATEFDGVSETLRQLKSEGYKMAIVSTKRNSMIMKGLRLMSAEDLFDTVIGLDDVQHAKPHPEPLLLAMERLNSTPEESIMIGDNMHDIIGGKNAGVRTAGVAWSLKGEAFIRDLEPDFVLQHISDLAFDYSRSRSLRRTERYPAKGNANSLWHIYKTVSFFKVAKNFVFIQVGRYTPFIPMKNFIYRTFLGMKIGKKTSFALMVMPDTMFPERITVGENSIIGFNTTILAHEYLIEEYRVGDVIIGDRVMIGANTTILARCRNRE